MTATSFDGPLPDAGVLPVVVIDEDELLTAFAEVMHDWGHCRTAEGLRFPTLDEARRAAAGRRADRGWNTSPIPG